LRSLYFRENLKMSKTVVAAKPTKLSVYAQTVEQTIIATLFPSIVDFVNQRANDAAKNDEALEDLTVDELIEGMEMSKIKPELVFGAASSTATKAKSTTGKGLDQPGEGKCNHQYGESAKVNMGKYCPSKAAEGSNYCKAHAKDEQKGGKPTVPPKKKTNTAFKPEVKPKEETVEYSVSDESFPELTELGFSVYVPGNFVVKDDNDVFYGTLKEGTTIYPLTAAQIKELEGNEMEIDPATIAEAGLTLEKPKKGSAAKKEEPVEVPPPPAKKSGVPVKKAAVGGKKPPVDEDEEVTVAAPPAKKTGVPAKKSSAAGKVAPPTMPAPPADDEDGEETPAGTPEDV